MRHKQLFSDANLFLVALILMAWPNLLPAQTIDTDSLAEELEQEIRLTMKAGKIPSVTVALVSGDEIIWSQGFGFSNLWAKTQAVPETVYLIGSTFKTMSMYALLQLMEEGLFELDDPVNDYLDEIKIRGEDSSKPVTFRHLFTHTSGLPGAFQAYPVWGDKPPPSLDEYLKSALELKQPPMTKPIYSNLAYSLIGYLVQKFSGMPFKKYIRERIFKPLEMTDTAFAPRPDMTERLAIPYVVSSRTGINVPTVWAKADVWPAGIVYGTVLNQASWLIINLNRGEYKGKRLISEETFDQVMTRQYDQFKGPMSYGWLNETTGYGLTWWISKVQNQTVFAHSGSVNGYTAFMVGNLERKTGFAILTNGNRAHKHLFALAQKAMDLMEKHRH